MTLDSATPGAFSSSANFIEWRDCWPLVAQTDDGNHWADGECWLYCRRDNVRVLWVGSVGTPSATGDLYACGPCLAEMAHMVRLQCADRDAPPGPGRSATLTVPEHVPVPSALVNGTTGRHRGQRARLLRLQDETPEVKCMHRKTEKRKGKTFCTACDRQIYL